MSTDDIIINANLDLNGLKNTEKKLSAKMEQFKESLLLENSENDDQNGLLQEFMKLYGGEAPVQPDDKNKNYKTVEPTPEFCIKTKSADGKTKIFLNMCTADHIPSPKDISDQELIALLDSEDPSRFRVPMSLGEPHAEVDKGGNGCTAYDIAISESFCEKIKTSDLFMGFFMSVIMEGLESKYEVTVAREWVKLKNKKCMGKILTQHIRNQSKPWIQEVDPSSYPQQNSSTNQNPGITEVKTTANIKKAVEPKYKIVQDPVHGHPDFLIAEVELPEIRTSNALTLDIGEDCIILDTRSKLYYLEIYLPFNLIQEDCGAQFDKQTHKLTLTLPVVAN